MENLLDGSVREIRGWCAFCRSRCGSISRIEDGRLVGVRPDPDHPTGGAMCPKGRAAPEIVYSDRRILHPMKRTRPKGDADPGWVRIGWDEALDTIAHHMDAARREHGAESVAFGCTTPSGTAISDSIDWIERFVRSFGSPNTIYATELCNWHKDHAHVFTFGCAMPTADYRNADLAMLWGHNPSNVWLAQASALAEGRRRGARLLVIDPRRSRHAADADLWLQIRPGTDAALALGISRILIAGGYFDSDFVRCWTNAPLLVGEDTGLFLRGAKPGSFVVWDELAGAPVDYDPKTAIAPDEAARLALRGRFVVDGVACRPAFDHYAAACEDFLPERVEAITSVPVASLHEAAALIAGSKRIAYHAWTGIGQHANATQTERAVATLYALTGAFDRPGGNVRHTRPPVRALAHEHPLSAAQAGRALGLDRLPLGPPAGGWILGSDFYDAVLTGKPYPVDVLMCFGANLLVSQPDGASGREALKKIKFHAHCDLFHTPTSVMADILLPVNTAWERPALRFGFEITAEAEQLVQYRPAMIAPIGESKPDYWIAMQLARRLGLGNLMFDGDIERGWAHALEPTGLDLATLKAAPGGITVPTPQRRIKYAETENGGVTGFATETGRVSFYSELLHRHGQSPVPMHVAPPGGDEKFPCRLSCAKTGSYLHSQNRGIASLRRRMPDPIAEIGPALAAARDIRDGERVRLSTAAGVIHMVARIEPSLPDGQVVAQFGWWDACPELGLPGFPPGSADDASYNSLIDGAIRDPISGAPAMRALACDIARAATPIARRWPDFREFRVVDCTRESRDTMSVSLAPADGGDLVDHLPGQHLPIRFELPDGTPVERRYSLSSAAGIADRKCYRITVRAAGPASRHIVEGFRVGRIVGAGVPQGHFVLPMRAEFPVVMIAAGIGITPFIGALETLLLRPDRPEILLLNGVRDARQQPFGVRLRELAGAMPEFALVTCHSQDPTQPRSRVSADLVPQSWIDRRARFYLCGPDAMMADLTAQLMARGVFRFDIFSERFSAGAAADIADPGPHRVVFRKSGRVLDWTAADGTLLQLADRAGLVLPAGCRTGQCESCSVPVIGGDICHLSDVIVDDGQCLTCQAVPRSALELDA